MPRARSDAADDPPARRTRRGGDDTRDRILDAATDLFSARSFDGASTRDIAAAAGVSQPTVAYHFASKEALWRQVVDRCFAAFRDALVARRTGLDGVDDLTVARLLIREFVVFSAAHPDLHRIVLAESGSANERTDWLVDEHLAPVFALTTAMFERLTAAGHLPPLPPEHLHYVLTGAGPTIFVQAPEFERLTGQDPTAPDRVARHAEVIDRLLFPGLPPLPPPSA
jgi:AcrR family transcriptional regulator